MIKRMLTVLILLPQLCFAYYNGSGTIPELTSNRVQSAYALRSRLTVGTNELNTYAGTNTIGIGIMVAEADYATQPVITFKKTTDSTFLPAHEPTQSINDRIRYPSEWWWYGSIVDLDPDTEYDINFVIGSESGTLTVRTRSEPGMGTILTEKYVSKTGSDSADGSIGTPYLTIQHAIDSSTPGTRINVSAGTYKENLVFSTNGTSNNPIILQGVTGTILDGHDVVSGSWTLDTDDLYYTTMSSLPSSVDTGTVGQTTGRKRQYQYCSGSISYPASDFTLSDLQARAAETADLSVSWAPHYSIMGGWWFDPGTQRLYVRDHLNRDLNSIETWIGGTGTGIELNANYIIIQGMTIQYFNYALVSENRRFNIFRGNTVFRCQKGVEFRLLTGITGYDTTGLPDYTALGVAGNETRHIAGCLNEGTLIEYNKIYDPDTYAWGYGRGKTKPTIETTSIQTSGIGTIVRNNYTQGFFKGISLSWDVDTDNRDLQRDVNIYNNIVVESVSDAIEPEGNLINVKIWGNYCRDMWTGVSIAPVRYGPMYVWNNVLKDWGLTAYKLSSSTLGKTYLYNNTAKTDIESVCGWKDSGPWDNVIWKNNILICKHLLIDDEVDNNQANGSELDYNLYYTSYSKPDWPIGSVLRFRRVWLTSIAEFYSYFTENVNRPFMAEYEQHGLFGNTTFMSEWPIDDMPVDTSYRPVPGSIGSLAGISIPNFSDQTGTVDIGLVQYSSTYNSPTITGPNDFSTTEASVEIEGTYTVDPDLPDQAVTVTWTLGGASGFCVAALGVFSCTVPDLVLGANSIVFRCVDSNSGEDEDTTVVTRLTIKETKINGALVLKGAVIHQ